MFTPATDLVDKYFQRDAERLALIGAITMLWSTIEHRLFTIFRFIATLDMTLADTVYMSLQTHQAKRNLVRRLTEEFVKHEDTKRSVLSTLDEMKKCADQRNRLVHNLWVVEKETNDLYLMTTAPVKSGTSDIAKVPIRSLRDTLKKLHRLSVRADMLVLALASHGPLSLSEHVKKQAARKTIKVN